MKKETVISVIVLFVGVISVCGKEEDNSIQDYYWREFSGEIPSDAIPGGIDRSGRNTYIGQIYVAEHGLLPGTIYLGGRKTRTSVNQTVIDTDEWVKILCGRDPLKFYWMPVQNSNFHLLINCHLIIGGTENGYPLNIGRGHHEMETVIGKVFPNYSPTPGLIIPNKESEITYLSYEILTYNCKSPDKCIHNDKNCSCNS